MTGGGSIPLSDTGPRNRPKNKRLKPVSTKMGDQYDHYRGSRLGAAAIVDATAGLFVSA